MATSNIKIDEGTTTQLPTYDITEDAATKKLARTVLNTSAGAEISVATSTLQGTANTSLGNIDTNAGATTDASITAGATGTISSKLRKISADIGTLVTNSPALGQALAAASVPVILPAATVTTLTPPAAITGFATAAKQPALGTAGSASTDVITIQGIASGTVVPISVATIPSHAVTNAGTFAVQSTNQANSGVDIGDVTINNASGASAVNIQDGGNSLTVDGAVTVTNATATNLKAEVVGTGTFVTQATLAAETTKVIGTVNVAASQTIATTNAGTFATQSTLVPQTLCSGVTSAMTGTTSTSVIGATASNYIYITQITVANSHATVGTMINFQDGSGGTTIYSVPAAAVYGGATITFPKDAPLKVPTAGNALYCANVTTGSNTYVSASGWKSTVSY